MNREEIITGLTDAQADGLACVICGLDYLLTRGSVSVPVGRSMTGSQVFVRIDRCAELAGVDPTTMGRRAGGGRR
ncbi:hypothetical protein GCM10011581_05730 [Saccharopolyspora subtropica]|uniref:Uncharacterized protein n=1 Tax=Saccharopolyspora thermophila TaxID=89367 RepID=A0A917N6Q9_9PSEU|nr:hypothetical protein [Saccharopolyspora subtropica]GGI71579.1 hypothetical protein GCM10011581_05730 [Saccharopolyspora subtropica]